MKKPVPPPTEAPADRLYHPTDHLRPPRAGAPFSAGMHRPGEHRTMDLAEGIAYGQVTDDFLRGDVVTGLARGAVLGTAKKGGVAAGAAKTVLFYVHPASIIFAVIDMLCDRPKAPKPTNPEVVRNAAMNTLIGALFGHPGG
ncbi:hypothetical protein PO587_39075 [Streptomyces gilvifuscus]|uniref:Uncharacterized protein n=1 Tax=Streptomyces gilvifuscus TaxID=1550617 RepID=A0ABT5G6I5_9ACTN|nr:hypothetical protein [Streptomyces gilvifuscus]MDC2960443.1 hypothetical protein [Streptomyces gilvifuscus]